MNFSHGNFLYSDFFVLSKKCVHCKNIMYARKLRLIQGTKSVLLWFHTQDKRTNCFISNLLHGFSQKTWNFPWLFLKACWFLQCRNDIDRLPTSDDMVFFFLALFALTFAHDVTKHNPTITNISCSPYRWTSVECKKFSILYLIFFT